MPLSFPWNLVNNAFITQKKEQFDRLETTLGVKSLRADPTPAANTIFEF
ncbi:MAG: hypothetical protein U7123_10940 [Potamolinea sp.]